MAMTWQEVIYSPYLQNLPFKIELSKWGKVEIILYLIRLCNSDIVT